MEDLDGKGEASHHSGESYRQLVEEFLESQQFSRVGDPYSGVSDIRFTRPGHKEEKIFRVETKNTESTSLLNDSFVTALLRHFLDFNFGDELFELRIYAPGYAKSSRWDRIFDGRFRDNTEIQKYYEELLERHNLQSREAERLSELSAEDFIEFTKKVKVKKVSSDRLKELTRDNKKRNRPEKKWEFYVRENSAVQEPTEYLPNFFRVSNLPDHIWTIPTLVTSHSKIYNRVPRYYPVWFEEGELYSLLPPEKLPDESDRFLEHGKTTQHDFSEWLSGFGDSHKERRIPTILLNKQFVWRGTQIHDRCKAIRHNGSYKLIITVDGHKRVQSTLSGEIPEPENAQTEKYESYTITRDMGLGVGHRYGYPQVKWYNSHAFVFLSTGWVFTENGRGESLVKGNKASRLHDKLGKQRFGRTTNHRAEFRQWRQYLRLSEEERLKGEELAVLGSQQKIGVEPIQEFSLSERPPVDADERDTLMKGEQP